MQLIRLRLLTRWARLAAQKAGRHWLRSAPARDADGAMKEVKARVGLPVFAHIVGRQARAGERTGI